MIDKLYDILQYYKDTFGFDTTDTVDSIANELLDNDVEVRGNSFYCKPIWKKEINTYVLLAGTKDKADIWVMKNIIRDIKSGIPILSALNGNSDYLLDKLQRYNVKILHRQKDMSIISFNRG